MSMNKWPVRAIKTVEKVWGTEFWIANNEKYCLKYLYIEPGRSSSLHYHKVKDETFLIDQGYCHLQMGDKELVMYPGDSVRLMPETPHRFWIPKGQLDGCMIVEVSTHHDDEDVVRLEESRIL
jgi:mannose-6-phosphate isomerase-like protein (cupin superfamily)